MFRNLGQSLRLCREFRGLGQKEVAKRARVGKSQLSKYERGTELPRLDTLERVLNSLNVGCLEFFYTLQAIDHGEHSKGSDSWILMLGSTGSSILDSSTQKAFQLVMGDLLKLYGNVLANVVRGLYLESAVVQSESADGEAEGRR